ncbi:hypothetical protein [Bradyrhizobium sp. BRP56]|uniref:hypothetical protein n=1 Tax=Bradyrhizobium sp. BRP56 TaxID=2793819 RepID=UPI001CD441BF|nr:hypothetical protein [Bradyrhizobium sp. BRP56]MCA1401922.1 hypothetical protein [Bradyrhizobium sp. BRP56]
MTDIVTDAIAEGLRPAAIAPEPGQTARMKAGDTFRLQPGISTHDLALIGIDAKLARLVDAAERQADAFETFVALFASCIGTTQAFCPGRTEGETPLVNFLRASADGRTFKCDSSPHGGDDDGTQG